jgi:hypothetical protein
VTVTFVPGIARVFNFNADCASSESFMASLAQLFPAAVGKLAFPRTDALAAPGSYFMQQPLVYPGTTVQSASFVQVAGKEVVAFPVAFPVLFD